MKKYTIIASAVVACLATAYVSAQQHVLVINHPKTEMVPVHIDGSVPLAPGPIKWKYRFLTGEFRKGVEPFGDSTTRDIWQKFLDHQGNDRWELVSISTDLNVSQLVGGPASDEQQLSFHYALTFKQPDVP